MQALSLIFLAAAAALQPPGVPLSLCLADYAGVPDPVLTRTRAELAFIFGRLGIAVEYPDACPAAEKAVRVLVRIAPYATQAPPGALGSAVLGDSASVFQDRIGKESRRLDLPPAKVLAYAIAHEAAHLILNRASHSIDGVLRGCWRDRELLQLGFRCLPFAAGDAREIREAVRAGEVATGAHRQAGERCSPASER